MNINKYSMVMLSSPVFSSTSVWPCMIVYTYDDDLLNELIVVDIMADGSCVDLGLYVGSIDDIIDIDWVIDAFVRDTEVESVGIGEGAVVDGALNATVVGLSVGCIVRNSSQVIWNVVDIAIGSAIMMLWHDCSV